MCIRAGWTVQVVHFSPVYYYKVSFDMVAGKSRSSVGTYNEIRAYQIALKCI